MTKPRPPAKPTQEETETPEEPARFASASADETGAESFPASDPPAVWTWEVDSARTG